MLFLAPRDIQVRGMQCYPREICTCWATCKCVLLRERVIFSASLCELVLGRVMSRVSRILGCIFTNKLHGSVYGCVKNNSFSFVNNNSV